nr:macrophage mannose receptor 1-like isoform X2 [Biomphalaria glabrata]
MQGLFRWTDGSAMNFSNWANYPPVVSGLQKEHCVAMNVNNGRWYLVDCSTKHEGFICSISYDDVNAYKKYVKGEVNVSNLRGYMIAAMVLSVLAVVSVITAQLYPIGKRCATQTSLQEVQEGLKVCCGYHDAEDNATV